MSLSKSLYRTELHAAKMTALLAKIRVKAAQKASRLVIRKGDALFRGQDLASFTIDENQDTGTIEIDYGAGTIGGVKSSLEIQDLTYEALFGGSPGDDISIEYLAHIAAAAATGSLNLTNDITLTSVATGAARNTTTFTLQVLPAAANPTDTVLAAFTGTAAAIVCTITPNDGTNNTATPVDLTTAELRELITTGLVAGKTVTITDLSSLRALQTATGGGAAPLADGGEGDGVVATFSGGVTAVGLAGSEVVAVVANAITVRLQSGVSTATQVKAKIDASIAASALVTVAITGVGGTAQTSPVAAANLAGGSDTQTYDKADILQIRRLRTNKYMIVLADDANAAP